LPPGFYISAFIAQWKQRSGQARRAYLLRQAKRECRRPQQGPPVEPAKKEAGRGDGPGRVESKVLVRTDPFRRLYWNVVVYGRSDHRRVNSGTAPSASKLPSNEAKTLRQRGSVGVVVGSPTAKCHRGTTDCDRSLRTRWWAQTRCVLTRLLLCASVRFCLCHSQLTNPATRTGAGLRRGRRCFLLQLPLWFYT
jgi:hypothetical protein